VIPKLTDALDFHSQALVLRAERQRVIAGNIANADTPGYKARDFNFAHALRDATSSMAGSGSTPGSLGQGIAQAMQPGGHCAHRVALRAAHARPTSTATRWTWTASAVPSWTTR